LLLGRWSIWSSLVAVAVAIRVMRRQVEAVLVVLEQEPLR
jgi:hypothetical protein